MVEGDGADRRRRRLEMIIRIVEKNPGIEREGVIGIMILRYGLTSQRIETYIDELAKYGMILENNGLYPRYHVFDEDGEGPNVP